MLWRRQPDVAQWRTLWTVGECVNIRKQIVISWSSLEGDADPRCSPLLVSCRLQAGLSFMLLPMMWWRLRLMCRRRASLAGDFAAMHDHGARHCMLLAPRLLLDRETKRLRNSRRSIH